MLVPDLLEANTVLLAQGVSPGAVDHSSFPTFGDAIQTDETVRTPFLTVLRFPQHAVQVEEHRVQFVAPQPTREAIEKLQPAILDFVDGFVGRRGVRAVGHNFKLRRRHPGGFGPAVVFDALVSPAASAALESSKAVQPSVALKFWPQYCSVATVKVEPSRVDDLEAIYFQYNMHYDLAAETNPHQALVGSLQAMDDALEDVDRISTRLLTTVVSGGSPE